jgi:hypothetical protein
MASRSPSDPTQTARRPRSLVAVDGLELDELRDRLIAELYAMRASLTQEMVALRHGIEQLQDNRLHDREAVTIAEAAELLKRSPYTLRQWAKSGRIHAGKRACGRGGKREWSIAMTEIRRILDEGLLPPEVATK